MNRIELLAPAGNMDCLKQAINNGADAVYLGGTNFSARAFANNFDNDEIIEAVKYAHLRNAKIYVTINTLLNEYELENALKQAYFYYENNVDALIIQDLGLYYRLKKELPDFEIHASTQMHIHNLQGVINAKELGFHRVVVARESSIENIKKFTKQGIEIEHFVHGAICVSYSGECLMSSLINNRSANKGMCAQCCRLKYDIFDRNNKKITTDTKYLLSPKDMFLLNDIPDLIEAGVTSLKIEGRMKSPAYVGYITSIYRKAIDAYYNNENYHVSDEELLKLKVLFNRDFTNSYLKNDNKDLFSNSRPNHMGINIGKVINIKNNKCFIKLSDTVNQFDGIRILNNKEDFGLILNKLEVNGLLQSYALKNDIIAINLSSNNIKIGDEVVKTQDYLLEEELDKYDLKKINLNLNFTIKENCPLIIKAIINNQIFDYQSDIVVQKAINRPITQDNIISQFIKTDTHPYNVHINFDLFENVFVQLKELNEIRRDFYNKLDEFILNSFRRNNEYDIPTFINKEIDINNINEDNIDNYLYTDVINPNSNYYNENNLIINEFGGLFFNTHKIAGFTLNIYNSYATELLLKLGFRNIILSLELNSDDIKLLISKFNERNNILLKPYIFIEGNRPLMYLNRNPFEKYININDISYISNGYSSFLVHKSNNCVTIYEKFPFNANFKDNIEFFEYKHKIV